METWILLISAELESSSTTAMSTRLLLLPRARVMAFTPVFSAGLSSRRLVHQAAAVSSSLSSLCVAGPYFSNQTCSLVALHCGYLRSGAQWVPDRGATNSSPYLLRCSCTACLLTDAAFATTSARLLLGSRLRSHTAFPSQHGGSASPWCGGPPFFSPRHRCRLPRTVRALCRVYAQHGGG